MGSGASTEKASLWTAEEQLQNENAVAIQRKTADKVAEYFYYGLPVKVDLRSHFHPNFLIKSLI